MGTLYIQFCDQCGSSTEALPKGFWPDGWFKVLFCDSAEWALCSYQCLFEAAKRFLDDPPTTLTPMLPQVQPLSSSAARMDFDGVPDHLRHLLPVKETLSR